MDLKLYHLSRGDDGPTYDSAYGFVVRARNPQEARSLAAKQCGDEGSGVWMDPKRNRCVCLTGRGNPGVIVRDFLHG
jgi:hypothetical protein